MDHSKIRVLSEEVIGKISAGEVVERPASIVKELVENSIDAGSDSIDIDIEAAGQALIRVADNGCGMGQEDAKMACLRHATSKISEVGDLDRLNTFGFRGEALASIAAVSQMEIITRSMLEPSALSLQVESGEVRRVRPTGRDRGTTIEVRNIFYNVPARRKFLKKEATELAEMADVVGRFIVSYPNVEFKLSHGPKTLFRAPKSMGLEDRIRMVLGNEAGGEMVGISFNAGACAVSGFISRPSSTRKDRSGQLFFVNRRYVKSKMLGDVIDDAYGSMLERGRYPAAVLFVEVPPDGVDVNVHPTKLLVKFDDEKSVKSAVRDAIRVKFDELKREMSSVTAVPGGLTGSTPRADRSLPDQNTAHDAPGAQAQFIYDLTQEREAHKAPSWQWMHAYGRGSHTSGKNHDMFQVGDCYIVRLNEELIEITDQHAAHERVFYEFFTKAVRGGAPEVQNLLFPVRLDLSASDAVIMSKLLDLFASLGFYVEHFGERSYLVQAVPAILKDRDVKTVVMDALSDLADKDLAKMDIVDEMVKIMSCRAAVKAGDKLSTDEMRSILDQLYGCELPFTCPHGRPTVIEIKVDDLEKMFRRK